MRKQTNITVAHNICPKSTGYTLLETIIVLAIISILSSSTIFYFLQNHTQTKTHIAAEQLIQHLQYARSEAIKRNQVVGLCGIQADNQCSSNWDKGYFIYTTNHPRSNQREIIKMNHYIHSDFSAHSQMATQAQTIQFAPSGRAYHNGKIVIEPKAAKNSVAHRYRAYTILIALSGRIKSQ